MELSCSNQQDCPLFNSEEGCREDQHHIYYPASEYTTPLEKRFRNFSGNVITICRRYHNDLHATQEPLHKPSREYMMIPRFEDSNE